MTHRNFFLALGLTAFFGLSGCSEPVTIDTCDAVEGMLPICGLQNPEDIESVGDGRTLMLSQMMLAGELNSGSLALIDSKTKKLKIFADFNDAQFQSWGHPDCNPPGEQFAPHGFHLDKSPDSKRLLVVNHGGRESIEAFELKAEGESYGLNWLGCVLLPDNAFVNDVVADGQDGFYTTHMFAKRGFSIGELVWPQLQGIFGWRTGWVWHWQPGSDKASGFSKLEFPLAAPNGIQMDAKGEYLYVNEWGRDKVHKLRLPSGEHVASLDIPYADNTQWDDQGNLLVVSQEFELSELMFCLGLKQGACAAPFSVYQIDPDSFKAAKIFHHQGAPMGAATVAQVLGEHLYLGTFAGDRLLRVDSSLLSKLGSLEPIPASH